MNTEQRDELMDGFVYEALTTSGPSLIEDVGKYIWINYEDVLRTDEPLFYTWHYEVRWAGNRLSNEGLVNLKAGRIGHKSLWAAVNQGGK